FFLPILVAGLLPWTVFLPRAIRNAWKAAEERRVTLFLLLWAGLVFAFFSASASKLVPSILPVLPPLALLLGRDLAAAWENPGRRGLAYTVLLLFAGTLGMAFLVLPRIPKAAEFAGLLGGYACALAASLLLLGLLPLLL